MNPSPARFGRSAAAFAVLVAVAVAIQVWLPGAAVDIGDWILFACALAGLAFIVVYDLSTGARIFHRGKWTLTREGRNIMALSMCIVAVVLLNVFANPKVFGPDYFARPAVRIVVYVVLLVVVVQRIRWLIRAQITHRQTKGRDVP